MPIECSKGEAGFRPTRDQPALRRGTGDGRPTGDLQERGEGDRRARRSGDHVHGQVLHGRCRQFVPHPLQPLWTPTDEPSSPPTAPSPALSDVFRHYLAGNARDGREFAWLFAPTVNSYKRYQPGSWAPTAVAWGADNRTCGFRIVGHGQGMRVESRVPGADANPYLAFAGVIAGGLHGIEHELALEPAFAGNAYESKDVARIPWNIVEAIDLLEQSRAAQGGVR